MKQQVNKKFWRTFFSVFLNALLIVVIILIFLWMNNLAYYAFANEPFRSDSDAKVEIQVKEEEKVKELALELEEKNVIENNWYMRLRYYCSDYQKYHLRTGRYQVSADMGMDDLLDEFTGR